MPDLYDNNHFKFGTNMEFKNFYDNMDKTPTYGEHSNPQTEETKLVLTI